MNMLRQMLYKWAADKKPTVAAETDRVEPPPAFGGGRKQAIDSVKKPLVSTSPIKDVDKGGVYYKGSGYAAPTAEDNAKLARRKAILDKLRGNQASGGIETKDFTGQADLKDELRGATKDLGGNPWAAGAPVNKGEYDLGIQKEESDIGRYGFMVGYLQKQSGAGKAVDSLPDQSGGLRSPVSLSDDMRSYMPQHGYTPQGDATAPETKPERSPVETKPERAPSVSQTSAKQQIENTRPLGIGAPAGAGLSMYLQNRMRGRTATKAPRAIEEVHSTARAPRNAEENRTILAAQAMNKDKGFRANYQK